MDREQFLQETKLILLDCLSLLPQHQSQLIYNSGKLIAQGPNLYASSSPSDDTSNLEDAFTEFFTLAKGDDQDAMECSIGDDMLSALGKQLSSIGDELPLIDNELLQDGKLAPTSYEIPDHIHEVAQVLNEIGNQVQEQYQAEIDEIIARAGIQLLVYANFHNEMNSLLDPMMEILQKIRLIIYFVKCYIYKMVAQGHNVMGRILENTAAYLSDIAADYLIDNGGWAALSEQRSNIPDSEVSPSSCANLSSMNVETLLGSQPDGTNPPPTQNDSNSTFYNIVQFVLFGVAVGLCLFYSRKQ